MYAFTAAYGVTFGPIAWILPSEVLPLSIRSKGTAISTASNWVNNCKLLNCILVRETPDRVLTQDFATVYVQSSWVSSPQRSSPRPRREPPVSLRTNSYMRLTLCFSFSFFFLSFSDFSMIFFSAEARSQSSG